MIILNLFILCMHIFGLIEDSLYFLLLSTHSHDPCKWGDSDLPTSGLPASSAVTPAGFVHKSRGHNVVCMGVQLKR